MFLIDEMKFHLAAEFLGFDNYIPPFATGRGLEILQGLNYASGASGILDESGQHTVINSLFSLSSQNY